MRRASRTPIAPQRKGYDAGKKVSGIKCHIAVDTLGLPHAIAVTTAEVADRKGGALLALAHRAQELSYVLAVLARWLLYVGHPFAQAVKRLLGARVQIASALCPSAGSLKSLSPGSTSAGGYGRTASEASTSACSSSILAFLVCYSEDRDQALTSAIDEDGRLTVRQHLLRLAAEK